MPEREAKPPAKSIQEAWLFDGTEASVSEAIRKYQELSFVWRADGESFINWRSSKGSRKFRSGKYLVRFSDGTFGLRFRRAVLRNLVQPTTELSPNHQKLRGTRGAPRNPKGDPVQAWIFDGTRESVRDALDEHPVLNYIKHRDGDYLLWEQWGCRYRVRQGDCLVLYADGNFAKRQRRVARRYGLLD